MSVDITASVGSDIAAVRQRIAEITGQTAPAPAIGIPPQANAGFASMVSSALSGSGNAAGRDVLPPEQIDRLVSVNATQYGVDPDLVKAIIANESGFNANATSRTGAQGLMQLMPGTAAGLGVADAYDPEQNVSGGTRYIRGLLDRFNGDMRLAVAAYNAGPGAVQKYGGVPPYAETQNYVQNVLASYQRYREQHTP